MSSLRARPPRQMTESVTQLCVSGTPRASQQVIEHERSEDAPALLPGRCVHRCFGAKG